MRARVCVFESERWPCERLENHITPERLRVLKLPFRNFATGGVFDVSLWFIARSIVNHRHFCFTRIGSE